MTRSHRATTNGRPPKRERHADLFVAIGSWLRSGGAWAAVLQSRDDPDDFDPDGCVIRPLWLIARKTP